MGHQIVRERAFLGDLAHEHRDRAAYRLIDINDEHLVVIAEKHRTPAACRQDRTHLHFDHSFVHEQTLSAGKRKTSGARRMGRIRFTRQMERANWMKIFGATDLHVRHAESLCALRQSCTARSGQMKNEWDVDAAIATYNVDGWGGGYFTVNTTGNVVARPLQENGGTIDVLDSSW